MHVFAQAPRPRCNFVTHFYGVYAQDLHYPEPSFVMSPILPISQ
jgi:hypothetical protein